MRFHEDAGHLVVLEAYSHSPARDRLVQAQHERGYRTHVDDLFIAFVGRRRTAAIDVDVLDVLTEVQHFTRRLGIPNDHHDAAIRPQKDVVFAVAGELHLT